jgi:hypothetical protein
MIKNQLFSLTILMAAVALVAVGLSCSLLSVGATRIPPAITERLKKILPEGAADFIPTRETTEYDPLQDEEDELQAMRNELSALYKQDETEQNIYDMANKNRLEDTAALIQQRRGRKFTEEIRNTACHQNLSDLHVDCGPGGAMTGFRFAPCSSGFKYEYKCLKNTGSATGEMITTKAVSRGDEGLKDLDLDIDLRTLYRHNVRCDVGGTHRFDITGKDDDTQEARDRKEEMANFEAIGESPLNSFRYVYKKNDANRFENNAQFRFKCLNEYTTGKCLTRKTRHVAAIRPEDLVKDESQGLAAFTDIQCPKQYTLTRFQLHAGGELGDGVSVPPLPDREQKGVYQYEYTCCEMAKNL